MFVWGFCFVLIGRVVCLFYLIVCLGFRFFFFFKSWIVKGSLKTDFSCGTSFFNIDLQCKVTRLEYLLATLEKSIHKCILMYT